MKRYRVKVETDYHTIAVLDPVTEAEASWPDPEERWPGGVDGQPVERLWSGHDSAVLLTESRGGGRIEVEVWDEPPPADAEFWEGVCETDLHTSSGAVALIGWNHENVSRSIPVSAGLHRIRVSVRDLRRASGVERGGELYRMQIYPCIARSGYAELKEWAAGSASQEPESARTRRPRRPSRPRGAAASRRPRTPQPARADHDLRIGTDSGAYVVWDARYGGVRSRPRPPQRLLMGPNSVVFLTESPGGGPIRIELWPEAPPEDRAEWAWTEEGDLYVESGRLEVSGLTDGSREPVMRVPRAAYRVRVSVDDPSKADPQGRGEELYRVQVFPATS